MAGCFLKYSRTSLKLPPKMRRFRGRLWAVVAYGNRTTWGLSSEKRSPLMYVLFFVCLVQCSRYSELRDQTTCKAVAYKRLKTMENFKTVTPKSGRVRLQEVVINLMGSWLSFMRSSNYRALIGKILVFWICGRL